MSRETMQLALEALKNGKLVREGEGGTQYQPDLEEKTIAALEAELAKPEQKPTLFFGRAVYFADPKTDELLDKKADNARELGLDYEPEQKPVAYACKDDVILAKHWTSDEPPSGWVSLYNAPPSTSGYAKKIESLIKERDELRQALSQPEQEPVAWRLKSEERDFMVTSYYKDRVDNYLKDGWEIVQLLYAKPPKPEPFELMQIKNGQLSYVKKEWQGLTDDEQSQLYNDMYTKFDSDNVGIIDFMAIGWVIEAKLREKNG